MLFLFQYLKILIMLFDFMTIASYLVEITYISTVFDE